MKHPEKNPAAVALGRLGGTSKSPAKRAASARNGAAGGRPHRPAGPAHVWTEGEVVAALGAGCYTAPAGAGLAVRAECLPGEDASAPAQFTVSPSWADAIGPHDDCDASVEALVRRISARFPSPEGWSYDRANGTIDQAKLALAAAEKEIDLLSTERDLLRSQRDALRLRESTGENAKGGEA